MVTSDELALHLSCIVMLAGVGDSVACQSGEAELRDSNHDGDGYTGRISDLWVLRNDWMEGEC